MDSFKLHEQLNVPAQKLTAGTTRKVCMGRDIILRADVVVAANIGLFLCIAVEFCAEHPGKFIYPPSG